MKGFEEKKGEGKIQITIEFCGNMNFNSYLIAIYKKITLIMTKIWILMFFLKLYKYLQYFYFLLLHYHVCCP